VVLPAIEESHQQKFARFGTADRRPVGRKPATNSSHSGAGNPSDAGAMNSVEIFSTLIEGMRNFLRRRVCRAEKGGDVGAGVDEKPPGPRIREAFCEVTPAKLHPRPGALSLPTSAPQRHDHGALPAWLHVAHGCCDMAADAVGRTA
jgi:hypothetical protein